MPQNATGMNCQLLVRGNHSFNPSNRTGPVQGQSVSLQFPPIIAPKLHTGLSTIKSHHFLYFSRHPLAKNEHVIMSLSTDNTKLTHDET